MIQSIFEPHWSVKETNASLHIYEDLIINASSVRQWLRRFGSGDSDVKDVTFNTAVNRYNEEHHDQLIYANWKDERWTTQIIFPDNDDVVFTALKKYVAFSGVDFYEHSMQGPVHPRQKCRDKCGG